MKKIFLIILFLSCGSVYAQQTWTDTTATGAETRKYTSKQSTSEKGPLPVGIYRMSSALIDSLTGGSAMANDTSAWTYEDTTLTLTTAATQLSVLLTRTKLIGDIVIQNAPASTVNIVGGWTSEASLVVFPSGSLHYDFLGNPKRFYLKSESGTPSVNISYKYKP